MSRLDDYRAALLAAIPGVASDELAAVLEYAGPQFSRLVIDHGLGPLWHDCTARGEFAASRRQAEALYMAQAQALNEIDNILKKADIKYAVIKGAANRLLLYDTPAIRACHDLDILIQPADRVNAAEALVAAGFTAIPERDGISRVLVLCRGPINIDLHWGLLREGRLRFDPTIEMLGRREQAERVSVLNSDDTLFLLLVHPAFAKHLSSWSMGLHRVADIIRWLHSQETDWQAVSALLQATGVRTAAWATLRWVQMLAGDHAPKVLDDMLADTCPGPLRRRWLERWLRRDLSLRLEGKNWARLLGFSMFLQDRPGDALRALRGRYRAHRRQAADLAAFAALTGQ